MMIITDRKKKIFYHSRKSEYTSALSFMGVILCVLIISAGAIFQNSNPIVLGTELNTNGLVEYLCLGTGCETIYKQ